ncbi:MAG: cytochrome c peroxidase [Brumimicrobium sp.]|nr:cytochrome c peroxidase [Brumimicrobium sp.]
MRIFFLLIILPLVICISCKGKSSTGQVTKVDQYDTLVFKEDLRILGEKLFFDKRLSLDNSISCASCHIPALAFTDGKKLSQGIHHRSTKRNSPSIMGVVNQDKFMWDGGVKTLELQVLVPLQDTNEMGSRISELIPELRSDVWYEKMSQKLFKHSFDGYTLTRALGHFQRSLYKENSVYDDWRRGAEGDFSQLKRGYDLFTNKLNCAACHSGSNFTDNGLKNNGIYERFSDQGHYLISGDSSDIGKFKVPGLRNVEITSPYMHDGSIATLEEVIEHYASGGKNHPNKSELIQPFTLTPKEKEDLLFFLRSLSDKEIKRNWEKVFR